MSGIRCKPIQLTGVSSGEEFDSSLLDSHNYTFPPSEVLTSMNIDSSKYSYYSLVVNKNIDFTFINEKPINTITTFTLELYNAGSYVIGFDTNVNWPGSFIPNLSIDAYDILIFITRDAGATWNGFLIGSDIGGDTGKTPVGVLALNVVVKTSDYIATNNDFTIIINANVNNVTVTLPTAVGNAGKIFNFKCIDNAFTAKIDGLKTQTIDNQLTQTLNKDDSMLIQSDGTNWIII